MRIAGGSCARVEVDALLRRVRLSERPHHRPDELTEPERRRLILARALAGSPSVLLADDPGRGLAPCAAADLLSLLRETAHMRGLAVVLATRDEGAAEWADRIVRL